MKSTMTMLGICGSLRKNSYNRGLLRAAEEVLPEGVTLETATIDTLPFFNQDVFEQGLPESVQVFREAVTRADALLICSPEYNYSVPAVLKNALDWASRAAPDLPLHGKPLGIMGASTGQFGTVRMQLHLRHIAVFTNMFPINKPEVLVTNAPTKFDEHGNLTDEATRTVVRQHLEALAAWTRRLQAGE